MAMRFRQSSILGDAVQEIIGRTNKASGGFLWPVNSTPKGLDQHAQPHADSVASQVAPEKPKPQDQPDQSSSDGSSPSKERDITG